MRAFRAAIAGRRPTLGAAMAWCGMPPQAPAHVSCDPVTFRLDRLDFKFSEGGNDAKSPRPAAIDVSICAPWPASTFTPTPCSREEQGRFWRGGANCGPSGQVSKQRVQRLHARRSGKLSIQVFHHSSPRPETNRFGHRLPRRQSMRLVEGRASGSRRPCVHVHGRPALTAVPGKSD